MDFVIRMGVSEMEEFWNDLYLKSKNDTLKGKEKLLFKKLVKALKFLKHDPKYPGLHSHEISQLSNRYGIKVWQSYLENNTPSAGRIFWVYGPERTDITIIGIEPHPEDKKDGYEKIKLSSM
ncbi:MAG: hypothetical protein PQJ46_16395 [Spirochaetales bacterium]|nr:hypothetical protein [Spirochaetales bacterium]